MRALLQRVRSASVAVDEVVIGRIAAGIVVFLGVRRGDAEADAQFLAEKCAHLRIFPDANGKFNRSGLDVGAEFLVVSQFTLHGDCRRGRRPSFTEAAPPEISRPLYDYFVERLSTYGLRIATGQFGANMLISIQNDGPVTLLVESKSEESNHATRQAESVIIKRNVGSG